MTKYEVQEYTLFDGWVNNWQNSQDGGLTYFNSIKDAQKALDWFIEDCEQEVREGNMQDAPSREDFRIVEVH
jgi:hypothetical protein